MADTLLDHLRTHLIDEGIVRDPRVAGPLPPFWREPKNGAPAPGEGNSPVEIGTAATVSAFLSGSIPQQPFQSFWRKDTTDLWLRTATAPIAVDIEAALRNALVDKRNWMMGGLRVIESREWRGIQRLGSDDQGFTFVVSYLFETYVP